MKWIAIAALGALAFAVAACDEREKASGQDTATDGELAVENETNLDTGMPGTDAGGYDFVMSVDEVRLSYDPLQPAVLVIRASGTTRTGGWVRPKLRPAEISPEGVRGFEFVAEAPTGPVIQVLMPIEAVATLDSVPEGVREIVVRAETNEMRVAVPASPPG